MTIAELAKILLGCYRSGDANDPSIYTGAVIAVLSDYPLDVVRAAVDPRTGLPARCKWLPTVAEIKEFCEDRMRPLRLEYEARKQLEEREKRAIADQRPRKTYEQIQAEFAKVGIFIGDRRAAPVDVNAVRDKFGITQEQWDAIPSQKRMT